MKKIAILSLVLVLVLSSCGADSTYRITFNDGTVKEVVYYACRAEGDFIACYDGNSRYANEIFFDVRKVEKIEE